MSIPPDPNQLLNLTLTEEEVTVLREGLLQWGGPADCSEELAVAMGFEGRPDLRDQSRRIIEELSSGHALTRLDWTRALLSTEINFASDVMGAGYEWSTLTGLEDVETLQLLRGVQSKLVGIQVAIGSRRSTP